MKSILIPTDFSAQSRHTLKVVLDLMHKTQIPCHVLLLNTYLVKQTESQNLIQLNDELKNKSKAGLEKEREEAMRDLYNSNIKIETASHLGSLKNVIMQLHETHKFDLVAIGKDGGKQVDTIAAMLNRQQCPILITHIKE